MFVYKNIIAGSVQPKCPKCGKGPELVTLLYSGYLFVIVTTVSIRLWQYEQEVHILRQQLLEAQERLQQTEIRLLDHEVDTQKLMDEWQYRLVESEEKMKRQQAEKDEQMKAITIR